MPWAQRRAALIFVRFSKNLAFVTGPETRTSYVRSGDTRVDTWGVRGAWQTEAASARTTASAPPIVRTPGTTVRDLLRA